MYNNGMDIEQGSRTEEILLPEIAELLKPEHTAIIVVDVMDAYFSADSELARLVGFSTTKLDQTAKKIREFLEEARKYKPAAVVFTRMIERPDSLPPNLAKKMETDKTPALVEVNGPGWDYYEVAPQEGDHEITKRHYSSFQETNLDDYLKRKDVTSVIVVGGYGSRCVARTADDASDVFGYHTFVLPDLIANPDTPDVPGNSRAVDEIPGFVQRFGVILGYTPNSQTVLKTWANQVLP